MMKIFLKIFVFEHSSFCLKTLRIILTTSRLCRTPPIFLRKIGGELPLHTLKQKH